MNNNNTIAIIGAMDCEIDSIKEILEDVKDFKYAGFNVSVGSLNDYTVIVSKSGVGKVNAASTTQFIIDKFSPNFIVNTGVAGGIGENLSVGDIVIATLLVQHDVDITALGYPKGYISTGVMSSEPTFFNADEKLIDLLEKSASKVIGDFKLHKGIIATGDLFVATTEKKKEIKDLFDAIAVEMEACAIAQTATKNNVPFVVLRSISDLADLSASKSIEEVESIMAEFAASVIKEMLNLLK